MYSYIWNRLRLLLSDVVRESSTRQTENTNLDYITCSYWHLDVSTCSQRINPLYEAIHCASVIDRLVQGVGSSRGQAYEALGCDQAERRC